MIGLGADLLVVWVYCCCLWVGDGLVYCVGWFVIMLDFRMLVG